MLYIFMERRTLVKSGASSFTVALPIDWVRKHKLDKGSEVSLQENEQGEVIIHAEKDPHIFASHSNYTIKVTRENASSVYWELLRAYLKNYLTINVEGENVAHLAGPALKQLTQFIGLDIMEQTKNLIVIKNFSAQDTETSPYSLLKKIDVGVRAMWEAIYSFFDKGFNQEDVLELQSQHEYNQRVYLFALKMASAVTDNSSLMRTFKTDYLQLMKDRIIINSMMSISFNLGRVGKMLIVIDHKSKPAQIFKESIDFLYGKYRTIVTLPKSSISKEILTLLEGSKDKAKQWDSRISELKNTSLIEITAYALAINNLLDQLSLELMP